MNELQTQQLDRAKEYALSKGGLCLSTEYNNNRTQMIWKCSAGHSWNTTFKSVVNSNQWCITCARKKQCGLQRNPHGLELANKCASSRGGKCLSIAYKSNKSKMLWQCSYGHEPWSATFEKVVSSGRWCPHCANENKKQIRLLKDGLQRAKSHAALKNGFCLTTEYKGAHAKLTWQCSKGHPPWQAKFNNVLDLGNWCPLCAKTHLSEQRTRLVFEAFFGKTFPSQKPSWNINPWTNKLLELDGYCKEFNIAFEYDGEHHFSVARYGQSKQPKHRLTYQQFRDEQKRKNCRRQGITLINIPFLTGKDARSFEKFFDNIVSACKHHDLSIQFQPQELSKLKTKFYTI